MKRCIDANHEGDNPLPLTEFYKSPYTSDGRQVYCKECHKARSQLRRYGVLMGTDQKETRESEKFIARHRERREKEFEIEESLMREKQGYNTNAGGMSFADIKFHSLNPEPVFRDLTNYFQRPQTKVSHWRTA